MTRFSGQFQTNSFPVMTTVFTTTSAIGQTTAQVTVPQDRREILEDANPPSKFKKLDFSLDFPQNLSILVSSCREFHEEGR